MNVKAISKNVGLALLVSALFMLLSVIVSICNGKDSALGPLLISFTITAITGLFPFIFVRKTPPITLRDGFVTIVLAWVLSFVFGMLPYVLWGGEFTLANAWFESVSGFTTTGATILKDIEALPQGLLFWRSCTHFIGGLGVVVFLLLIVPSASPFRKKLTSIEVSSLSKEGYNLQNRKMVMVISGVYLSLFILSTVSLFLAGMPFLDAVNHGFSVSATGGFSTKNASVAYYDSEIINIVLMFFMVVSATNFALIYTCILKRSVKPFFKNRMVRYFLSSILVMSAIVILSLQFSKPGAKWERSVVDGLATVISYVTTTGFGFADNRNWPLLASVVLLFAATQCGMAGSTSSGIKADRMTVVFTGIRRQIRFLLHPADSTRIKFGDSYMSDDQVLPIFLYIVLYFIIVFACMGLLLVCGVGGIEALSGSIACMGNVGPGLGEISIAGNYSMMPVSAKLIFALEMFLGRIEIYPFFIVLSLLFKRNK